MRADTLTSFPGRSLGDVFEKLKLVLDAEVKREYRRAEIGSWIDVENQHTLGDWIRSMVAYGFIDKAQPGCIILTEYGCQLASNPELSAVEYCKEAFFNVAIFKHLHEKFGLFAEDSELRREMATCGIKESYITHALRVFKLSVSFVELWDEGGKNILPVKAEQATAGLCRSEDLERLLKLYDLESDRWSTKKRDLVLGIASRLVTNLPNNV